jgi:RHS repeat-associated protein
MANNVYADFSSTGSLETRYLTGPALDQVFAQVAANGTTTWNLTDSQGSVRQVVGVTGNVLDTIDYDAYGNITSESNASAASRFKYDGMAWDAALGLYLDHARAYDPADGDFISQDPLSFSAGQSNLTEYVGNGPTDGTDPSGTLRLFGHDWVAPWSDDAAGFGDTISAYGDAASIAAAGAASGAATGAATGATTGATVGAIAGAVGGAGVGAAPGALAGAATGATAGAIGGGIAGLFAAAFSDDVSSAAKAGAISGAVSGVLGGAGAGLGAGLGAAGSGGLTHFTTPAAARAIAASGLGKTAASNLFATTGKAVATTVSGRCPVAIAGAAAKRFTPPIPVGLITAFQKAAGHMVGPRGVLNLQNGSLVSSFPWLNTVAAGVTTIDGATSAVVGAHVGQAVNE